MCVVVAANLAPAMPRQARKGSAAAVPNSGRVNGSGGLPRGDVIVTAAMRQPLDEVRNLAEQAIGRPLVIEYGSARGNLKQEILAGRSFEVALLPPDVDADLTKADKILPGIFEIARDTRGRGITRQRALGSGSQYARVAEACNVECQEPMALGPGEYEICLFPISENIPNQALTNLRPVMPSLQVPVLITAVVGKHANDLQSASSLIKFLQGPAIGAAVRSGVPSFLV
jgi:hypothetical protein